MIHLLMSGLFRLKAVLRTNIDILQLGEALHRGLPEVAGEIAGPDGAAEAVGGGVYFGEHGLFGVEGANAGDRAEDFLAPAAIGGFHAGDDGGIEVIAAARRAIAAAEDGAPGFARFLQEL